MLRQRLYRAARDPRKIPLWMGAHVAALAADLRRLRRAMITRLYQRERDRLFSERFAVDPSTRNAVIISSYPKSGNTLFRMIWLQLLVELEDRELEADFRALDEHLPTELYFTDLKRSWPFATLPCLLKTHQAYAARYAGFRVVHVFRNPLDTLVSFYHYQLNRQRGSHLPRQRWLERLHFQGTGPYQGNFREFARAHVEGYCAHFVSWLENSAACVSYENLVGANAQRAMSWVLRKLDLDVDPDLVQLACERSQPQRVRHLPPSETMAQLGSMNFVRDGSVGQWRKYFGRDDLLYLIQRLEHHGIGDPERLPPEYREQIEFWPSRALLDECGTQ